jgi:hypothetical protein
LSGSNGHERAVFGSDRGQEWKKVRQTDSEILEKTAEKSGEWRADSADSTPLTFTTKHSRAQQLSVVCQLALAARRRGAFPHLQHSMQFPFNLSIFGSAS